MSLNDVVYLVVNRCVSSEFTEKKYRNLHGQIATVASSGLGWAGGTSPSFFRMAPTFDIWISTSW